jgi:predicted DNA-binding protein (UPF0251 family)
MLRRRSQPWPPDPSQPASEIPGAVHLEVGRALLAAGNISVAEIAKRLGVSRMTFYQYFPQARARSQVARGS